MADKRDDLIEWVLKSNEEQLGRPVKEAASWEPTSSTALSFDREVVYDNGVREVQFSEQRPLSDEEADVSKLKSARESVGEMLERLLAVPLALLFFGISVLLPLLVIIATVVWAWRALFG